MRTFKKSTRFHSFSALVLALMCSVNLAGQSVANPQGTVQAKKTDKELKTNLNDDGSHYLKATFTAQVWARYNESNPGTTYNGFDKPNTFDIGLRRVRSQIYGKITDKVFLYTQFGINNFNPNAARKPGIFFHDVVTEYAITPRTVQMGMGLTAWTGFARFSSPAVASILGYDAPLYQQATNDATDQFLRKFSVYAKGKVGKLDYRVIMSTPMSASAVATSVIKPLNANSDFALTPAKPQFGGYFMYQFLDEESNLTPYMSGTYLGKKKVFNIGAGFQYQKSAMWHNSSATVKDTVFSDMIHIAVDVFYDHPLGDNGAALSVYGCAAHMDYGYNYIRNNNPMNPADAAVAASANNFNGGGNLFPMYGTGNVLYAQIGYLIHKKLLGETNGQLQPYIMLMDAKYDRLQENMELYDIGINYLMEGHRAKMSLDYQNRPVFDNTLHQSTRKGMAVLQFQIAI